MKLSTKWRNVLNGLNKYGETGIHEDDLCYLLGGDSPAERRTAQVVLNQMFFNDVKYFEEHPFTDGYIRITAAGKAALEDKGENDD